MGIKIAISGKGGVGKSTLAAALALLMARKGTRVLAVDADPDANLASALGMGREAQQRIVPIAQQRALIEERTGAKVRQYGQIFKLNPDVSDIVEKFATPHNGVALLVLGAIEGGGTGCACPENIILRSLMADLVLHKNEAVIMDMEAGIEHLGRATASAVDTMIVVVEPGQRSLDSACRVARMAQEIGLTNLKYVANKIAGEQDEQFVRDGLGNQHVLACIPFCEHLRAADRPGRSVLDGLDPETVAVFEAILLQLGG